ncbi:MAG: hypothetical protein ACXV4B_04770 [Halobacteriota archaeon]
MAILPAGIDGVGVVRLGDALGDGATVGEAVGEAVAVEEVKAVVVEDVEAFVLTT